MKTLYFKLLFFILLGISVCFSQEGNEKYPTRVILNLTSEPTKSMAVTWRTIKVIKAPQAQISEVTDWIDFVASSKTIKANTEKVTINDSDIVYHHSVLMEGLKPNTQYIYRVGGDSVWTEWIQYTTAKEIPAPFEFVFLGDPQVGFQEYIPRIFRKALMTAPNAAFWLYVGDIVDRPKIDQEWNAWFNAAEFINRTIPSVMVPGNHEYAPLRKDPLKVKSLTRFWKTHFTLPENGADSLNETSYYFDYQGVRFIMLNGQEKLDKQANWLERLLADNQNKWTIATVHQPMFSMGAGRDERDTRNAFMGLFDKYSVDLVLTGHDHVYSRSYKLKNGSIVKDNERGTVYVLSVSGTKAYELTPKYKDLMVKIGEKIQLFQVIIINNNKLLFKSYTSTGVIYDAFELKK